jgi:hypothetical protein
MEPQTKISRLSDTVLLAFLLASTPLLLAGKTRRLTAAASATNKKPKTGKPPSTLADVARRVIKLPDQEEK